MTTPPRGARGSRTLRVIGSVNVDMVLLPVVTTPSSPRAPTTLCRRCPTPVTQRHPKITAGPLVNSDTTHSPCLTTMGSSTKHRSRGTYQGS
jgi:hypothetical protein